MIGARHVRAGRGSGRGRRSCPPRDRRAVGRVRSRRSRSTRRGRRPGGSRRCAGCCGSRSRGTGSARPTAPTHADAGGQLADRAAAVQHLERHVVGEHDEEDEHERQRQDASPAHDVDADPEHERDDDRALDHRVEEAGEESGADTGEHELERDALRRRDRDAVVEEHVTNLDEFVPDRSPRGPSSSGSSRGRAAARAGSVPTACAASARATARPPPTSRSRAGAFPGDPVVARLEQLVHRGRHARVQHADARADGVARVLRARLLAARPRAPGVPARLVRVPRRCRRCSPATGRGAIPGPRAGSCRARTSR